MDSLLKRSCRISYCSVTRLATGKLPFRAVQWITPGTFVAAGHDYVPLLYSFSGSAIEFAGM